jgi:hypothetical protein
MRRGGEGGLLEIDEGGGGEKIKEEKKENNRYFKLILKRFRKSLNNRLIQ